MPRITRSKTPATKPAPAKATAVAKAVTAPRPAARKGDGFTSPAARPATTVRSPEGVPLGSNRVQPAWLGNTAVSITRAPSESPKASETFTFGTWARQRAATAKFNFEVWAPGTTDRDNPDLWRDLDVEVHYRYGSQGAWKTDYVSSDGRAGNNARYALDLRKYDPWSVNDVSTTRPKVPVTEVKSADGRVTGHEAKLEFYFAVNGKELRASNGAAFEGKFENY
jgi:hypothetical protein